MFRCPFEVAQKMTPQQSLTKKDGLGSMHRFHNIYVKKERERERARERGLYGDSCDRLRIQCFVVHRAGKVGR